MSVPPIGPANVLPSIADAGADAQQIAAANAAPTTRMMPPAFPNARSNQHKRAGRGWQLRANAEPGESLGGQRDHRSDQPTLAARQNQHSPPIKLAEQGSQTEREPRVADTRWPTDVHHGIRRLNGRLSVPFPCRWVSSCRTVQRDARR